MAVCQRLQWVICIEKPLSTCKRDCAARHHEGIDDLRVSLIRGARSLGSQDGIS